MQKITIPIEEQTIRSVKVGDPLQLSGVMITGRDTVHKWMIETFIKQTRQPERDDLAVYDQITPILEGGVIYHCGPVVAGIDSKDYRFVAAGPTTSIREEPYQGDVMKHFHIRGVIGKGGMGKKTLKACNVSGGAYLHAIGGAASLIAQSVVKVIDVFKLEFGVPEAMWVIEVKDFPVVVTMDSNFGSLHEEVKKVSDSEFSDLIRQEY